MRSLISLASLYVLTLLSVEAVLPQPARAQVPYDTTLYGALQTLAREVSSNKWEAEFPKVCIPRLLLFLRIFRRNLKPQKRACGGWGKQAMM